MAHHPRLRPQANTKKTPDVWRESHVHMRYDRPSANGSVRTRAPVRRNTALAIAGAITGIPSSPTPDGGRLVEARSTSTAGAVPIRGMP